MIRCDALIVGGGPAGSTCARALQQAGWDVVVADRARFPRDKVCAGWLTPDVFTALELDPVEYEATGLTFQRITRFRTGLMGRPLVETAYSRVVSYAIRRCEFDDFLLHRAGVRVLEGTPVETFRRVNGTWIVNDSIEARVLIGAGGHFCPVARDLRGGADTATPVVAKEAEFRRDPHAPGLVGDAPSLFFCRDLDGYGWCVPKGDYVNVGIGRRNSRDFAAHVRDFVSWLERSRLLVDGGGVRWRGHAYLASGAGPRPLVGAGVMLIGDAAGLAYPESGEGIKPAIVSARLAADTLINARGSFEADDLQSYADATCAAPPPAPPSSASIRVMSGAVGRVLLGSPAFARHVVLNRWFLRL